MPEDIWYIILTFLFLENIKSLRLVVKVVAQLRPVILRSVRVKHIGAFKIFDLKFIGCWNTTDIRILRNLSNPHSNMKHYGDVLKNLTHFTVGCPTVTDVSKLTNLTYLDINTFEGKITDISMLTNLQTLCLHKNELITDISMLTNLRTLHLSRDKTITDISTLTNLTELDLNIATGVRDLSSLTKLTKLSLQYECGVHGKSSLTKLTNLTDLSLVYVQGFTKFDISKLILLKKLHISEGYEDNMMKLPILPNLETLNLASKNKYNIPLFPKLVSLTLMGFIPPEINKLTNLTHLDLSHTSGRVNITKLTNLVVLDVYNSGYEWRDKYLPTHISPITRR
jgi:hypothetical protein